MGETRAAIPSKEEEVRVQRIKEWTLSIGSRIFFAARKTSQNNQTCKEIYRTQFS